MNAVECNGLSKEFGRVKAVNHLTFTLGENKITGLIGPNGAGKTTLLKIMAGFLKSSSGEIKVFTENPFNNLKVSSNMIFIDDNMTLPQSLCLADILESAERFYENWDIGLARGLFEYFSLHPNQYYNRLSKGMKSTFNVIIGISARCPLTVFDEPTTGMDAGVRKDFYRALLRDYLQHPRTVILSSHLLNEIQDILEDVLLIREGKTLLHLPVSELKEYAVGLRGKKDFLEGFMENIKEVYHKESLGKDNSYLVVRNNLDDSLLRELKMSGVEITPVAADDLCVYLTTRNKGGIDRVFNRD
jgi:ABC-2 type transport system ATP-binding protein